MRKFGALTLLASLSAAGLLTAPAISGSAPAGVHLSGVVRDTSGAGVRAHVSVARGAESADADTAADGSYSLSLPPGPYTFKVQWSTRSLGLGPNFTGTAALTLAANRVENVTLPPPTTVNLRVIDSGGAPVPAGTIFTGSGSSFTSSLGDGTRIDYAATLYDQDGNTDTFGAFPFQTFPGTSFTVMVVPQNALSDTTTLTAPTTPGDVVIRLPAAVTVSGVVRDASGTPARASIGVSSAGDGFQTMTAADGSYSLSAPPGSYAFSVDLSSQTGFPFSLDGTATISVTGDLHENVTLPPTTTVNVHVVDSKGTPVTHSTIIVRESSAHVTSALGDGSPIEFTAAPSVDQVGNTGATNGFTFETLRGISFPLTVGPPHALSYTSTLSATDNPTETVVAVPDGVLLSGAVRESDGTPSLASIVVSGPNGSGVPFRGPNGSYSIYVPPGTYTLGLNWMPKSTSFPVAAYASAKITVVANKVEDITLPPVTTVHVHVVDSRGAPVAQAGAYPPDSGEPVTTSLPDGTPMQSIIELYLQSATTDGSGSASFAAFQGASFTVRAVPSDALSELASVTAGTKPTNAVIKIPWLTETKFAPPAPVDVSATPGNGTATIRWTQPGDGGSFITQNLVAVYLGSVKVETFGFGPGTRQTIDLEVGKTYRFQVTPVNALGDGTSAFSNFVTVGAPTAPGTPVAVATATRGRVKLKWAVPSSNSGATITGYFVIPYRNGVAQPAKTSHSKASTEFVTGLTSSKSYTFTVAAINARGTGLTSPMSKPVTVK